MTTRRITALILSVIMILSMFSQVVLASDDKTERTVYLYARADSDTNGAPTIASSSNVSVVYTGEDTNVMLAVDNPNKGEYIGGVHTQPQYDMNGYTVKIYFDPAYFDYAADSANAPINYKIPNAALGDSGSGSENTGSGNVDDVPQEIGYYVYRHGSGTYQGYNTAYITVFTSGEHYPQSKDLKKWYDLLELPLKPLKTGSTEVFIDVDGLEYGTPDDYKLELFAKNNSDKLEDQTFDFNVINGGRHTIVIRDRIKPIAPVADPGAGRYSETQNVTLTCAEPNSEIWYKKSGDTNFVQYTNGDAIEISVSDTISCYSVRKSDGKKSNTVDYRYTIVPKAPHLFDDDKKLIPNNYSRGNEFEVFVSDKETWGDIEPGSEVYYTFAPLDETTALGGDDPYTQWVPVHKAMPAISIKQNVTVRLITDKTGELSDISEYKLGINPGAVTADPAGYPAEIYDQKIDVRLSTDTTNAVIYYTVDGSDPISNGLEYISPITLTNNTVVRAVAYYDGRYGDVATFNYIFDYYADDGITAFYPSGVYEGSVNVTLIPNNPENEIQYSTDNGATWVKGDTLTIDRDTDLIAVSIDKEGNPGAQYSFTYRIKPLPPMFAPESTHFTNANEITVYCVESNASTSDRYELYYTLDGTDPITSSTRIKANEASDTAVINISKYTQVRAVIYKDKERYSTVITHSYDIVTVKPVEPITTLAPGNYTREIGSTSDFTTQFMPVPEGTEIYYTMGSSDTFFPDPMPGGNGVTKYVPGDEIVLKGDVTIKAVAVNVFGIKSDVGIFQYVIRPEAPKAAPSATIYGDRLPVVPVYVVEGSTVNYEINGEINTFIAQDEIFYIDTATGNAYKDKDCTELIGILDNQAELTSPATLNIYATLDGVDSFTNTYVYATSSDSTLLAPPFADKDTGTYEEIDCDGNNNHLLVSLDSINPSCEIEYRINDGGWTEYDGTPIGIKEDTVLQTRAVSGGNESKIASYVYEFVPLAPIIVLPSGRYVVPPERSTKIIYDSRVPDGKSYDIYYRSNGDIADVRYMGNERIIDHTMSFKAYVLNKETGRVSKNAINYYIIENGQAVSGSVYVAYPYDAKRISSHKLSEDPYTGGIKLVSQNKNADIHYYYSYTKTDGVQATTNKQVYDNVAPIIVNKTFDEITIIAWLEDSSGKIEGSDFTHTIDFIDLDIAHTSLGAATEDLPKGTEYTLINAYNDDKTVTLYYTLDGSDPSDEANANRIKFSGEKLKLENDTDVTTVYHSTCGTCVECKNNNYKGCWYEVYGPVATHHYDIKTTSGTGGGGGGITTVDKTRQYTKDIFGNEHPTHIGYINGYPDGSVQPDGNITREEVTAILYRVKDKGYDSPVEITGEVFPDVELSRWSVTEIEYMADQGVVLGYPDGEFKPVQNLTRAEFAALISRFTGLKKPATNNMFPDISEEHWAYKDVMILTEAGLMRGYEDGAFRPESYIKRAEVMTVINKILGRCPDEAYVKSLDFKPFNDLDKTKWYYVDVLEATITHDYFLNKNGDLEINWENWK